MKKQIYILILMIIMVNMIVYAVEVENRVIDYKINTFLDSNNNMLGLLIPALLLLITLITFSIDFGTVGVSMASVAGLIVLYFMNVIYINVASLTSFVIIIGIMVYKMQG